MAHNSRFVHTRIIWQAVYQAKPDSPKCVNWILQRIILSQLNEMKRNEMCLLFAKFKFWGKNCTYIIRAVTRALRCVHHCAKVREAIPFYFSLYIHCICICICTSICIYTPIAFAIAFVYVFVGCAKVREAFLVLLLTLYSYNLRLLLLFPASLLYEDAKSDTTWCCHHEVCQIC